MSTFEPAFTLSPHKRKKMNSTFKGYVLFAIAMIVLMACNLLQTSESPSDQPVPANRAELCKIVKLDPETNPTCHGIGWKPLLETAFPPGVATIQQVHEALSPYLVDSRLVSYWTHESYAIAPGLLGPVRANFSFNEDGLLEAITIED
jgi:hypothetical protein